MSKILRAGVLTLALAGPLAARAVPANFTPEKWWFSGRLGLGHWADVRLDDVQSDFTGGLALEWLPARHHALKLDLGTDRYRRTYAQAGVDAVTGSPARTNVDEWRWSAGLTYGYEFLHDLTKSESGRTTAQVLVGGSYFAFDDSVSKAGALPLGAGLRLGRALGDGAEVFADAFYGYAVAASKPGNASVLGAVKAQTRYGAGLAWRFSGARVETGYRGEVITLEHGYRILHSLGLQVGFGF